MLVRFCKADLYERLKIAPKTVYWREAVVAQNKMLND